MSLPCADSAIESSALGLLLATGLVTGSVLTVLEVAKRLSQTHCQCVLPALVMQILEKYMALNDTYELGIPNDDVSQAQLFTLTVILFLIVCIGKIRRVVGSTFIV